MSKEYTYSMPQKFMDDPNVALKWKLYGYLNGFWLAGKPVYARNDTIAKQFEKSERAVQLALGELEEMGLITRDIKGLSRYILPGGLKDEGRSPASPQDEAQLRGGTKPSFTIVHIDNTDTNTGALEDELRVEKVSEGNPPSRFKPAKYPNARTAFSWLPNRQDSWDGNTTQLSCGELLFKRGEDAVKSFVRYVKSHEDDDGFDWIFVQPSDYERKWETIKAYAKRNS